MVNYHVTYCFDEIFSVFHPERNYFKTLKKFTKMIYMWLRNLGVSGEPRYLFIEYDNDVVTCILCINNASSDWNNAECYGSKQNQ